MSRMTAPTTNHHAPDTSGAFLVKGHPMSDENDDGEDFCYVCDKDTTWEGEHCTGCHREWGYEYPPIFQPGEQCGECQK